MIRGSMGEARGEGVEGIGLRCDYGQDGNNKELFKEKRGEGDVR